ncbi:MAG TPA: hypothetical protein VN824_12975, partial [Puia sp.]|nr:hypothetical protein [Puia sp.]
NRPEVLTYQYVTIQGMVVTIQRIGRPIINEILNQSPDTLVLRAFPFPHQLGSREQGHGQRISSKQARPILPP